MTTLRIAGQTDVGQRRRDNQDTFTSKPLWNDHTALLVVIDGVGGYAGGDRAAAIAKAAIEQYMTTPTGDTLTMLREAVVYANNQIAEQRRQDPQSSQMCCVLTAAVADAQARSVVFVHVGDTRLYRFRPEPLTLEKLTRDHSIVGIREDANQLTEAEAMRHPRRNEILREVGSTVRRVDDPDFLESGQADFERGDVLLLCSDGLTDMLTRAQLTTVLTEPLPEAEQVAELIRRANEQGGYDNITVVLARNNSPAEAVMLTNLPAEPAPGRTTTAELTLPTESDPTTSVPPARSASFISGRWRSVGFGALALGLALMSLAYYWLQQPDVPASAPVNSLRREVPVAADSSAGMVTDSLAKPDSANALRTYQRVKPDSSRKKP